MQNREKPRIRSLILLAASLALAVASSVSAGDSAGSPKISTQFVTVDKDVRLEVLDWGGPGRPLILLAALGATAHAYDAFAPKLSEKYHVYGITRRGFGASSIPATGYSADRLGDDVLAVIDALKIDKPILVGHSVAGEELSSIGSRHPEKISGLVYLEAAESYAFYDPTKGNLLIDSLESRKQIDQLVRREFNDEHALVAELLQSLPRLENDLREEYARLPAPSNSVKTSALSQTPEVFVPSDSIFDGMEKYTSVGVPVLAIFAYPHAFMGMYQNDASGRAKAEAQDLVRTDGLAKVVREESPSSRIVLIPHATHMIFSSNESEVLQEIDAFVGGVPRA
jgi:pimeloyl-ACP methyl ester carboxylesterase